MSKNHKGRGVNQKNAEGKKRREKKEKKANNNEDKGKRRETEKKRSKSEKPCDVIDKSFDEGKEKQKGT